MIAVQMCGGLGNQMFQYAAGRQLAIRHGTELVLDASDFSAGKASDTAREYELWRFRTKARLAQADEIRMLRIGRRMPLITRSLSKWYPYREYGYGYNPEFQRLPSSTYLVGYWQSHRYFSDAAAQIASEFTSVLPLSKANIALGAEITQREAVAVHIRRGDYVSLKSAANFHGLLPQSYYLDAIARIQSSISNPYFAVFSDDPQWCMDQMPFGAEEGICVSHNVGVDAWQDLMLMACCQHHVIANSSFSWWGAWLADQRIGLRDRLVFAPAAWFKQLPQVSEDRFPPHWMVL
jgi:hypothetical protein